MRIVYDGAKAREIESKLDERLSHRNDSRDKDNRSHVYDIIFCPMKTYNRLNGVERTLTKRSVADMFWGVLGQRLIQSVYPREQCEYEATLVYSDKDTLFGHVDVYEDMRYPFEVKVTKRRIFRSAQIPRSWIEQLMAYMSLTGSNIGWFIIVNRISGMISAFRMELEDEERVSWLADIMLRIEWIRRADDSKDPYILPAFTDECEDCDYKTCVRRWGVLPPEQKRLLDVHSPGSLPVSPSESA